jgi:hypothetical protein
MKIIIKITVNSSAPFIISFSSSSRGGVYTQGESVDFQVTFNLPVVAGSDSVILSTPILLLNTGPIGRVVARYDSGRYH